MNFYVSKGKKLSVLWNEISAKSNGGTELLCRRLEASLPAELLEQVQIIPSRLHGELDETKIRILWLHDLPQDPESQKIFSTQLWKKFHKIIFVSQWQMQHYIQAYNIPWSACCVIPNSIEPITRNPSRSDPTIRFVYHTTPHRGLDILYAAFDKLSETHKDIHLDVFSSFEIYGWPERNEPYKQLFENIDKHQAMTNHGFQSNEKVREILAEADVFAYPSVWPETSCLALMEAMSAGMLCVHPNFGALAETAANWTMMYQFHEDPNQHAGMLYGILDSMLKASKEAFSLQLQNQKSYVDIFYNWNNRKRQWIELIESLASLPREFPQEMFEYRT